MLAYNSNHLVGLQAAKYKLCSFETVLSAAELLLDIIMKGLRMDTAHACSLQCTLISYYSLTII